jgi:hypothetical protein
LLVAASDFYFSTSAFCFVYPAQAVLNSTPQLLVRDRRAVVETQNFWFLVSGF